jgi:hypothetical protein
LETDKPEKVDKTPGAGSNGKSRRTSEMAKVLKVTKLNGQERSYKIAITGVGMILNRYKELAAKKKEAPLLRKA